MTQKKQTKSQEVLSNRERRRRKKSRSTINTVVWWIVGSFLVLVALSRLGGRDSVETFNSYRPEDVVYGQSFQAIHEMNGSDLGSIQFFPADEPQPQIAVSESFFNFGSIGPTEIAQHEFVIANLGEAPLIISRAYTTCGCTTADFTASEIPPGKVVLMTLTLDAGYHDVRGQTVKRGVIIENNDPSTPELVIWTQADVRTTQ